MDCQVITTIAVQVIGYWKEAFRRYQRFIGRKHSEGTRSLLEGSIQKVPEVYWKEALRGYQRFIGGEHSEGTRGLLEGSIQKVPEVYSTVSYVTLSYIT
jgi:molybdate-binding protein